MAAIAGTELCDLLRAGNCLCDPDAYVGADCVLAAVLFRLRIHGHFEFAANGRRQMARKRMAPWSRAKARRGIQLATFAVTFSDPRASYYRNSQLVAVSLKTADPKYGGIS